MMGNHKMGWPTEDIVYVIFFVCLEIERGSFYRLLVKQVALYLYHVQKSWI